MIISASRRTDIPAFYGEWLMEKIQAGYVDVKNPFNAAQISHVDLSPGAVDCFVFWTRNPGPFIKHLDTLDAMGYPYYFQYTITGYGSELEGNRPDQEVALETFVSLSERLGKHRVIFRYDPIILTDKYTISWHLETFRYLMARLGPHTERVVFSFVDAYRRTAKAMRAHGVRKISEAQMHQLVQGMMGIAAPFGVQLETCAEAIDLKAYGVTASSCVSAQLVARIIGESVDKNGLDGNEIDAKKIDGKVQEAKFLGAKDLEVKMLDMKALKYSGRNGCGCVKSVDIGSYHTCHHGCVYCYATGAKVKALE